MAHRTIVGIDVGTTKVCTVVAQVQDTGRTNVLGVGLTPSKGLKCGIPVELRGVTSDAVWRFCDICAKPVTIAVPLIDDHA